jgi:hypothetical protein
MNAADWQAAAEVLGVLLVLGNVLGGMFIYRMQASFVTRSEHNKMGDRMNAVESEIGDINTSMARLVTTEDVAPIYTRLGNVEQQTSRIVGRLDGLGDLLTGTNNMLQILVKNEIEQGGKKQ